VAAGQMANFKTSTYPNIVLLDHFADQVALALAEL
jgi:hypothetical protein